MDEHGKDAGLTAHKDTAGAGGEGQEEARAEEDEEDDGEEHFSSFLLRIGKIKYAGGLDGHKAINNETKDNCMNK